MIERLLSLKIRWVLMMASKFIVHKKRVHDIVVMGNIYDSFVAIAGKYAGKI